MADITATPAMRSPGPAPSSRPFAVHAVLLSSLLLLSCRPTNAAAAASAASGDAVRHVRHKRTVSDFVEGLMNAMYFHSDPTPVQSTVIARITHLPATKVYKYVPVRTVKLSKLRARHIAEPKYKIKYPKKYSIKTDDASLTVVKNDLPWTLHPLPPPLPATTKTIKLEVDKSMPWALHPLPPPVKTKSYAEYYWPDAAARPRYVYHRAKRPARPHRFGPVAHGYHYQHNRVRGKRPSQKKPPAAADYAPPAADYGHDYSNHVDDDGGGGGGGGGGDDDKRPAADYDKQPDDHKYDDDYNNNNNNNNNNKPDHGFDKHHEFTKHVEFSPVDFKQIDFKQVDFKHVDYKSPDYKSPDYKSPDYKSADDYKSPDYKTDFPKHGDEEQDGGGGGGGDNDHDVVFHHSFSHDDHESRLNDMSSQPPSADFVSHITIEPSIQIAAFTDTELQGDGSNRDSVSQGDVKQQQKCQCTTNGHRHRRDADAPTANSTAPAGDQKGSPVTLHAFFGPGGGGVGHATEVQIVKSHDITDQSQRSDVTTTTTGGGRNAKRPRDMSGAAAPWRPVATGGERAPDAKKNDFRDESDKFRVDFGGATAGLWDDEPGRSSSPAAAAAAAAADDAHRQPREQDPGKNYHIITTVTKTTKDPADDGEGDGYGGGVGFSVRTPFSVSSFSSNVRHPLTDDRFRLTDGTSSPLLSSLRQQSGFAAGPLDFEQFGLRSALIDDKPLGSGRLRSGGGGGGGGHFSRGRFDDGPSSGVGQLTSGFSTDGFGGGGGGGDDDDAIDFSGRLTSPFSRGFGDDRRSRLTSSRPFRYRSQSGSDLFDDRFKGGRASSGDSVLEYFQPVVIDFDRSRDDRFRHFGKSDAAGFTKFKRNQNSDPLRLPGGLHESNENLSRKMIFHPSTFDID